MAKTGLGKGLSALIPLAITDDKEEVREITLEDIVPSPFQPREDFAEDKLRELAASIKEHGVVQPIVVRELDKGKYELVVGERRWRACQLLGWAKLPAVIKKYNDQQIMEIVLVENIQRQDLNPLEEAQAYKRLVEEFAYTQKQVGEKVAKSRPYIANMIRMLNLPEAILAKVATGELSVGHVRPLLTVGDSSQQIEAATEMLYKKMTVREAEDLARKISGQTKQTRQRLPRRKIERSPEIVDLEGRLREKLGTKITIKEQGEQGKIEIEYYGLDDLNRILSIFI